MTIYIQDVQWQGNAHNCDLFALANATLLCNGSDLCTILHTQSAMRQHFLRCIEQQYLAPFPQRGKKRKVKHPKIQLIDLFCICRLPKTAGDQMVYTVLFMQKLVPYKMCKCSSNLPSAIQTGVVL